MVDGPTRFRLQHNVRLLHRVQEALRIPEPVDIAGVCAGLRRVVHSREAATVLDGARLKSKAVLKVLPLAAVRGLLEGASRVLDVVHVASFEEAGGSSWPRPGRQLFRAAAKRRLEDTGGVVARARKQRRSDLDADAVLQKVLWARASLHVRDQSRMGESVSAMVDARSGAWGAAAEQGEDDFQSKRTRLRDLVRVDVVSCLLQRREARQHEGIAIRGLRADGSPKLNAEIFAVEMESFCGHDPSTRALEFLPGGTLAHGLSGLPNKIFQFLWGLFCCFGPTLHQLRACLSITGS